DKRSQLFLRSHNETLSVIAVCIDNRDCSHSRIALLDWITVHSSLITLLKGGLATPEAWRRRAVSSVVEHLVYTERVGGSKPSPPSLRSQRGGKRRLSRRSFSEGGPFSPCNVNAASFDSACQSEMKTFTYVYVLQSETDSRRSYTVCTFDLRKRLARHNYGEVSHTAKWKPW